MNITIATDCTSDIVAKVKAIGDFGAKGQEKVFTVYSEEDLLEKTKLLKLPAVGIMYEGIKATAQDPSRQGLATDLTVALVLLMTGKAVGNLDTKNQAAQILDEMRNSILKTTSPTGHKWRFVSEVPTGALGNYVGYLQRWSTAAVIA